MTTFNKRQEGFEKKFAVDEELKFKAEARRNKLFGLWAAEKLGLSADDAAGYAKDVVAASFEEAGDADILRKVSDDLQAKGTPISEHDLRIKLDQLSIDATAQIKAGT